MYKCTSIEEVARDKERILVKFDVHSKFATKLTVRSESECTCEFGKDDDGFRLSNSEFSSL